MPFATTQWANSPDPREPDYIIEGWDSGQLSPWQWILATEDATGDLAVFNDGVNFENVTRSKTGGTFDPVSSLPGLLEVFFQITTQQTPAGGPPTWTVQIELFIRWFSELLYTGILRQTFPVAIAVQGPIVMTEFSTTHGTLPEPMTITPAKWNTP